MNEMTETKDVLEILAKLHSFSALDEDVPTWFEPWIKAAMGAILAERQRHAEEVARLSAQCDYWRRKAEHLNYQALCALSAAGIATPAEGYIEAGGGWLDRDITLLANERRLEWVRAKDAESELIARRALDADVRACAEHCASCSRSGEATSASTDRLLAADFLREPCPECHMVERCKMSCSRGGSKGARLFGSPIDESDKEPTP